MKTGGLWFWRNTVLSASNGCGTTRPCFIVLTKYLDCFLLAKKI